ncbi:hypothetical protein PMZ80_005426 [Knufia obscura]|uniref:Uncharacterized protein n=2 Tax=Knufia TaxID=430999 RepID=A0AAN8F131_9EURO|nr:hypothetical protein PMZ80_005426 [Knufia obscura]KAK5958096.1 hypothetical protein OHC33_001286 [Knufia fluminis]
MSDATSDETNVPSSPFEGFTTDPEVISCSPVKQAVTDDEVASLMSLSTEIRFMIYDYIVKCTGVVEIYSQHDIAKEVDTQTVHMLHVNRRMRCEVQEFFYKSQTFEFKSAPAVNKFVKKIGPYHASIIKNVQLGEWLCRRKIENFVGDITPAFQDGLTGVECLTISQPSTSFSNRRPDTQQVTAAVRPTFLEYSYGKSGRTDDIRRSPGLKSFAVLCASHTLACGKLYIRSHYQSHTNYEQLLFVREGITYPAKTEIDNPAWAKYEEQKRDNLEEGDFYGPRADYNPYTKHKTIYYTEVPIPESSVMEAELAVACAPDEQEEIEVADEADNEPKTGTADEPVVLSDDDEEYQEASLRARLLAKEISSGSEWSQSGDESSIQN